MTIPQKLFKKIVLLSSIPIIEEKEKLFIKIDHINKDIFETNHALF